MIAYMLSFVQARLQLPVKGSTWRVSSSADRWIQAGTASDNLNRKDLMSQITTDRLISIREVSRRLGLSIRAVYRLIASGEFPRPVKVGGASRFYESDLITFMDSLKASRR